MLTTRTGTESLGARTANVVTAEQRQVADNVWLGQHRSMSPEQSSDEAPKVASSDDDRQPESEGSVPTAPADPSDKPVDPGEPMNPA